MENDIRQRVEARMDFMVQTFFGSTLDMTGLEMGLYLLTLNYAWTQGARLPADEDRLRRTLRLDPDEWNKLWPVVSKKWAKDGAWLRNAKLTSMYATAMTRVRTAADNGRLGGFQKAQNARVDVGQDETEKPRSARNDGPPASPARSVGVADPDPDPDPRVRKKLFPKTARAGARAGRFEEFWKVYPRRVGKEAAFKAWMKLSAETQDVAIAAATAVVAVQWKAVPESERHLCPHPATWLNQGRWTDDPAATALAAKVPGAKRQTADPALAAAENDRQLKEARAKLARGEGV